MEKIVNKDDDFLREQKAYEADLPISDEQIENIEIPVKNISKEKSSAEIEELEKYNILCNIIELRGSNYTPTPKELDEFLSKTSVELKEIEKKYIEEEKAIQKIIE